MDCTVSIPDILLHRLYTTDTKLALCKICGEEVIGHKGKALAIEAPEPSQSVTKQLSKDEPIEESVDPIDIFDTPKTTLVTTVQDFHPEPPKDSGEKKIELPLEVKEHKVKLFSPKLEPTILTKTPPHFITVFSDVLSGPMCSTLLSMIKHRKKSFPKEAEYIKESYVQGTRWILGKGWSDMEDLYKLLQDLWFAYRKIWDEVTPEVSSYWGRVRRIETPFLWQFSSEKKDFHHGYAGRWTSALSLRMFGVILFLSDVEGGETVFPDFGVTVKPKAGTAVIFPAHMTHIYRSLAPISGDKWEVNSWFCMNLEKGEYPIESNVVL
jgi:hypothetical protein